MKEFWWYCSTIFPTGWTDGIRVRVERVFMHKTGNTEVQMIGFNIGDVGYTCRKEGVTTEFWDKVMEVWNAAQ